MGLGKQMLQQIVSFAKGMDYDALQVDTEVVGTEAAGFLLHSGFSRVEDAEDKQIWRISFR